MAGKDHLKVEVPANVPGGRLRLSGKLTLGEHDEWTGTQKKNRYGNMISFTLRPMRRDDWSIVGDLIHLSTNFWYRTHGMGTIFSGSPSDTELFCSVYETLDPGCCLVAVHPETSVIVGSCFYHPRRSHVSLGIMNVHPNYAGAGVARQLLHAICAIADADNLPVRLVSSAMNLDSYSLYTRAGFTPRMAFQDMYLPVPQNGIACTLPQFARARTATRADLPALVALDQELTGLERPNDFRYFLDEQTGMWQVQVLESERGGLDGYLVSISRPASQMLGPGVARTDMDAAALIYAQWNCNRNKSPIFLVPVERAELVGLMYAAGARNCEIHFAQVRGAWVPPTGVILPTFLPETF